MVIGVIAEGHSDRAVIINIMVGLTGLDDSDFIPLMPKYKIDATDEAEKKEEVHGGWNAVKDECEKRIFIDDFLALEGEEVALVIHFDTAESAQYPITAPLKDADYCGHVRTLMIDKITEWIGEDLGNRIVHAIAIEETEAWLLALNGVNNTWKSADAKSKFEFKLGLKKGRLEPDFKSYDNYSKGLRISKAQMTSAGILSKNQSLNDFCEEVITKVLPRV